jgi:Uma2 family endonuclease
MTTVASTQTVASPVTQPGASTTAPTFTSPDLYRFTVDQYERMGDAGILTEDDRVELVEGLIYQKPMKNGPHSIAARETVAALTRIIPAEGYFVTREDPVKIPGRSGMPEPDVSVVRGRSRDYVAQPVAGNVPLIVEVADKSRLGFDQGEKRESYASGGVPVYWIVNLVDRQVEVYTDPGPGGYATCTVYLPGQQVPVVIDGRQVGQVLVDEILP